MTNLIYLDNTYQFTAKAKYLSSLEQEKGTAIILDQSIFYPQGGGQPADTGEISSENGIFEVTDTRLSEDGTVLHFGKFKSGNFKAGEEVSLKIDDDKRKLNARNHSAGHLLDVAVKELGLATSLKPLKGYHFPDGPYVEYEGALENPSQYQELLETKINDLIKAQIEVIKTKLNPEEAEKMGIWAPPGKSARVINFKNFEGCGCGGTHVENSKEIGTIKIRKISSKKGKTTIRYSINP